MLLKKLINFLFRFKKGLFYIQNNISLPEPLSETDEVIYVKKCMEGSIEARNYLVEHNMRLVVFIAKKFESRKVLLEDLISIGSMGLIKGVETFKLDKNIKLATYASRCIENEILMFLRKISKMKSEISLDETLNIDNDGNELLLSDVLGTSSTLVYDEIISNEKNKIMYQAIDSLKPREKEIIIMRYGLRDSLEYTQKEVANLLGISQSYISRLEKKIIDKIRFEMDKKLHMHS